MKKLRYLAEYILLRVLCYIVDLLPLSYAIRLLTSIADGWYVLDARRKKVALNNILQSGICTDHKSAASITRSSYQHFGQVIVESLKSSSILDRPDWEKYVDYRIPAELDAMLRDPEQSIILATGHIGNWELAAQLLSRTKPVAGVTRRANNPLVNKWMQKRKPRHNFYLVPKRDRDDIGRFLQILKKGEILALMIDQYGGRQGMQVEFLGRKASTHTAIALLHLITGTPLCFGYCLRTEDDRYELCTIGLRP